MGVAGFVNTFNVKIKNRKALDIFTISCHILIAYPCGEIHLSSRAQICTEIDGKDRTRLLRTISIQRKTSLFIILFAITYMVGY